MVGGRRKRDRRMPNGKTNINNKTRRGGYWTTPIVPETTWRRVLSTGRKPQQRHVAWRRSAGLGAELHKCKRINSVCQVKRIAMNVVASSSRSRKGPSPILRLGKRKCSRWRDTTKRNLTANRNSNEQSPLSDSPSSPVA